MINKVIKSLNSMNSFSRKFIMFGCIPVFLLCIAGVVVIAYNNSFVQEVNLHLIGSSMISTSCVVFTQIVIAGLVMDFMNTLIQNHD